MKVCVKIKEELLKKGIEQICIESGFEIVETLTEDAILISDKIIEHKKQVTILEDYRKAFLSTAKIKLCRNVTAEELIKAIREADIDGKYIQKALEDSFIEFNQTKLEMGKLNARENILISKVIEGMSNREIGRTLYLSEKTVKNNLTELYKKLNVKNRQEIIKKCKFLLTENRWDGNIIKVNWTSWK